MQLFFFIKKMSLFDSEISQSIWNAKLPIKISFDTSEALEYRSDKTWDPIYVKYIYKGKVQCTQ